MYDCTLNLLIFKVYLSLSSFIIIKKNKYGRNIELIIKNITFL